MDDRSCPQTNDYIIDQMEIGVRDRMEIDVRDRMEIEVRDEIKIDVRDRIEIDVNDETKIGVSDRMEIDVKSQVAAFLQPLNSESTFFDRIPNEILHCISRRLNIRDVLRGQQVCSRWYSVMQKVNVDHLVIDFGGDRNFIECYLAASNLVHVFIDKNCGTEAESSEFPPELVEKLSHLSATILVVCKNSNLTSKHKHISLIKLYIIQKQIISIISNYART